MPEFGKVVLVNTASSERLERYTVDARELLASGEYVTEAAYLAPAETPAEVAPTRKGKA